MGIMDNNYFPLPHTSSFDALNTPLDFTPLESEFDESNLPYKPLQQFTSPEQPTSQPHASRKPSRTQRTKSAGTEQTKHRRTRSGCYTCRQRRVKCDEARPVCDRCRKGKRDCNYPDKPISSKTSRTVKHAKSVSDDSSSNHSPDDDEDRENVTISTGLPTPDLEDDSARSSSIFSRTDSRRSSNVPLSDKLNPFERTYEGTLMRSTSRASSTFAVERHPKWNTLSEDVKFYLNYHRVGLSYCHYAFKHDCRDFLKTSYLETALTFEPLLYAIVAFSAYHYALRQPDGSVKRFLSYYDRSVSLFRQSLSKGDRHPVATILTMLQLATIEEFLGDWVNLLGHQRAARALIVEFYTPKTILRSFTHRLILGWYWRFDVFASVMSGAGPTLGQEWFKAIAEQCRIEAEHDPGDLSATFDHFFTYSRLLATEVTVLFAKKGAGEMESHALEEAIEDLSDRLQQFEIKIESTFRDVPFFNHNWRREVDESDIVDFTDPHFMFTGPYFTMNYIMVDFWGASIIFLHQVSLVREKKVHPDQDGHFLKSGRLLDYALKKAKMLEAIANSEMSPPGAVLGCQASLAVMSLFLPNEKRYSDWTRRQFAMIEGEGYTYPQSLKDKLAELWSEDVTQWWLPNEEGHSPCIKSMREFMAHRVQAPRDVRDVDVRDMNGVFRDMSLHAKTELLEGLGPSDLGMDVDSATAGSAYS